MNKQEFIKELNERTGCGLYLCSKAYDYMVEHNGDRNMAIAYLKAECFAVNLRCSFDEKVQHFMECDKNERR